MNGPYAAQMSIEALSIKAVEACGGAYGDAPHVAKILALVRAHALEEAARVCEDRATEYCGFTEEESASQACAAAIRAIAAAKPSVGT